MTLDSEQTKIINRMVEPFVKEEWDKGIPCATGGTDRGVVVTLAGGYKVLVRLYRHSEKIPDADPKAVFQECDDPNHERERHWCEHLSSL